MRPVASPLGPEPPIINTDAHLITGAATVTAESEAPTEVVGSVPVTAIPAIQLGAPLVPSASPLSPVALAARVTRRTPRPLPPLPVAGPPPAGSHQLGPISTELIWQPRFAIGSAAIILLALTIVTLPLWIVLYRLVGTAGAATVDILALCMMLLGAFLASLAGWVVVVEMRARVRMVDTMARRAERELLDQPLLLPPVGGAPPPLAPRVEAQQVLEASGRLLASFSSVLKSFGQLWAQIAMLTVALALFAGATVLSLH
jgi:hypothetical protein